MGIQKLRVYYADALLTCWPSVGDPARAQPAGFWFSAKKMKEFDSQLASLTTFA